MGYMYVAVADPNGARVTASEYLLPFTPTAVEYPEDALGVLLETTDGQVVQQQPNKDPRRRAWVWKGYRNSIVGWQKFWEHMESLRSRTRIEAGAPTPYIFVKDTVTQRLRTRDATAGLVTSATATTLTSAQAWTTNQYQGGVASVVDGLGVGQTRSVLSNSATTLTVPTWDITPDGTSKFEVYKWKYDWLRARVLDVGVQMRKDGGQQTFEESRFVFVIDDPAFNDIG